LREISWRLFILQQREVKEMNTPLVQHSPRTDLAGVQLSMVECFNQDIAYARRKSTVPLFGKLVHERVQMFYIKPLGASNPSELESRANRDLKESAMHLPATQESLVSLHSLIERMKLDCIVRQPTIRFFTCHTEDECDSAILYSIQTRF